MNFFNKWYQRLRSLFMFPVMYWLNYIIPYKRVDNPLSDGKLMVAIMTIDRDADICGKVYGKLNKAIRYFKSHFKCMDVDITVVTRQSDVQCIEFWKSKARVLVVPHYEITGRHNMIQVMNKSNILVDYAKRNMYNYIMFLESDVGIHEHTITHLYTLLYTCHVSTCCGNVPWYGNPVAYIPRWIPRLIDIEQQTEPFVGLGTSMMVTMCDIRVFDTVHFTVERFCNIIGQDVGFYRQLFYNRYKLMISNELIEHYYDRSTKNEI